jgi:hypothetical protein
LIPSAALAEIISTTTLINCRPAQAVAAGKTLLRIVSSVRLDNHNELDSQVNFSAQLTLLT